MAELNVLQTLLLPLLSSAQASQFQPTTLKPTLSPTQPPPMSLGASQWGAAGDHRTLNKQQSGALTAGRPSARSGLPTTTSSVSGAPLAAPTERAGLDRTVLDRLADAFKGISVPASGAAGVGRARLAPPTPPPQVHGGEIANARVARAIVRNISPELPAGRRQRLASMIMSEAGRLNRDGMMDDPRLKHQLDGYRRRLESMIAGSRPFGGRSY